jgi:hypothetical protein
VAVKSSLFFEEKRVLARFPYAVVVGVLFLLRILSRFSEQTINRAFKKGPFKIILGRLVAQALS